MGFVEEQFLKLTSDECDPSATRSLLGKTEDLYLECKTIATDEVEENLVANKQSVVFFNFGKSISAFANAEGGIVVWGLFAKEQGKNSPDLIQEERPISKVTKVKTDFDSIIGKVVSRRVVGVKNTIVYTDKGKDIGFIVTYIPKSDEAPHRVEGEKHGSRRYYRRHGNGSYEMEHYELEELFGGRANPKLKIVIKAALRSTLQKQARYTITFGLKNVGKSIAKYPFLEIMDSGGLPIWEFGIDGNRHKGLPTIAGHYYKYQGGVDDIIHIDDILWIDNFLTYVDDDFESKGKECTIKFKIACDRFRMRIVSSLFDLRDVVDRINEFDYEE